MFRPQEQVGVGDPREDLKVEVASMAHVVHGGGSGAKSLASERRIRAFHRFRGSAALHRAGSSVQPRRDPPRRAAALLGAERPPDVARTPASTKMRRRWWPE